MVMKYSKSELICKAYVPDGTMEKILCVDITSLILLRFTTFMTNFILVHGINIAGEKVEYYMSMGTQRTHWSVSGLIMYPSQYMKLLDLKVPSFSF